MYIDISGLKIQFTYYNNTAVNQNQNILYSLQALLITHLH